MRYRADQDELWPGYTRADFERAALVAASLSTAARDGEAGQLVLGWLTDDSRPETDAEREIRDREWGRRVAAMVIAQLRAEAETKRRRR